MSQNIRSLLGLGIVLISGAGLLGQGTATGLQPFEVSEGDVHTKMAADYAREIVVLKALQFGAARSVQVAALDPAAKGDDFLGRKLASDWKTLGQSDGDFVAAELRGAIEARLRGYKEGYAREIAAQGKREPLFVPFPYMFSCLGDRWLAIRVQSDEGARDFSVSLKCSSMDVRGRAQTAFIDRMRAPLIARLNQFYQGLPMHPAERP